MIVAAAVAAATIVGWPLAGKLALAAASAYAVAAVAGAIAKDPPAPDPEFRELIAVEPLPLPEWPKHESPNSQSVNALRRLLEAAAHILALENAHTITRSRLMGAAVFGDQSAGERQREHYLELEREMVTAASELDELLFDVERTDDTFVLFDRTKAAVWTDAMVGEGLPLPLLKAMTEAGLSPEQINQLAALVTHEELMTLVKERGLFLAPLVESLEGFVREVQGQREAVLAGETYTEARRSRESMSEQPFRSVEAQLRLRGPD
jgi:hypothetical protein